MRSVPNLSFQRHTNRCLCQPHPTRIQKEHPVSIQDDNKAIVGRWFTNFWGKTCDLAVVDEIAAPDMLLHYSLHEPRRGRADIKAFMTDFRKAFPDLNFWGAADLIAEGDYVVGRWEGGGTHTGPAFNDFLVGGLPAASGRKMHFTGTTVLRLKDGKDRRRERAGRWRDSVDPVGPHRRRCLTQVVGFPWRTPTHLHPLPEPPCPTIRPSLPHARVTCGFATKEPGSSRGIVQFGRRGRLDVASPPAASGACASRAACGGCSRARRHCENAHAGHPMLATTDRLPPGG